MASSRFWSMSRPRAGALRWPSRHFPHLALTATTLAALLYIACTRAPSPCGSQSPALNAALLSYPPHGPGVSSQNATFEHFKRRSEDDLRRAAALLASWPENKPKAAYFVLARQADLQGVIQSVGDLEARFNRKARYPYIFVNDAEFGDDFMAEVEALTDAPVFFGGVPAEQWGLPAHVDRVEAETAWRRMGAAGVLYGGSESYRHMCRYFSGFFMNHPLLRGFDYYWRVEPNVRFYCSLQRDPFAVMRDSGASYGWNIILTEIMETIPSLWATSIEFLHSAPSLLAAQPGIKAFASRFRLGSSLEETLAESRYNGCHFWSNFEIGRLDFLRGDAYQRYFQHLDSSGGFFMERWGDAPVHSIAAMLFLNKTEIHQFEDIGYTHDIHTHCPQSRELNQHCSCNPEADVNAHGYCMRYYKRQVLGEGSKA
ncbi:Glycolipid 2-alpha-mannosyltransferase 1 [Auxenochlorella protothecoides]|nr:Glycolipid 2-alpha-mannosyltransferase 1 [Auxenochlorella protothecoides]KFM24039.1 Glycolipid 2-alpha-mannosyltransferase 1 [Auxenochlorella protothecoides]RMZ53735.1 hypothetical protein APUTEX25_003874 [Auxenochlorella protothecoides]|eukprot:RMZ53735.1 hypothetical protein APUTEX25_003874 [Auxenochlorella protothecoides]